MLKYTNSPNFSTCRHIDQSEGTPSATEEYEGNNEMQFVSHASHDHSHEKLDHFGDCERNHQASHQHNVKSRPHSFRTEDETFPPTKTSQLYNGNPKMNTILLYNNISAGTKRGKFAANKTISNYFPKNMTSVEKKRAVSAGKQRKKSDINALRPERNRALDHMFGDHVIEELDLAMQQGGKGTMHLRLPRSEKLR